MFEFDEKKVEAALRLHVDRLAGLIGPRPLEKPKAFHAAAAYVERELKNAGYEVGRQPE
jgi:hypothetical protein